MAEIQPPLTFTPLSTLLTTIHDGREKCLLEPIDDTMADVGRSLKKLGGSARVVVTLNFSTKDGRVVVGAVVTRKKPEAGAVPSHYYLDNEGRLVETNPDQRTLPFPGLVRSAE